MTQLRTRVSIIGMGHFVPESILTNSELEKMVDTTDEWIQTRTGIKQRRIVNNNQACSDLAYEAAKNALKDANLSPQEITHIVLGTFTPDVCAPATACILQEKLGMTNCEMALDIAAGCSGFAYGLEIARGIIQLNPNAKVIVVGSEVCTSRVNFKDRNTCVLFGDGAGAAVVSGDGGENEPFIVDIALKTIGDLWSILTVGLEGCSRKPFKVGDVVTENYFIQMNGREVFKHAVRNMSELSEYLLKKNGFSPNDIDLFIPHQANYRIIEAVAKKLEVPMDKVFVNVDKYGNTSAASVILALSEAKEQGLIKKGNLVLMTTFGAGLTVSSVLIRF